MILLSRLRPPAIETIALDYASESRFLVTSNSMSGRDRRHVAHCRCVGAQSGQRISRRMEMRMPDGTSLLQCGHVVGRRESESMSFALRARRYSARVTIVVMTLPRSIRTATAGKAYGSSKLQAAPYRVTKICPDTAAAGDDTGPFKPLRV